MTPFHRQLLASTLLNLVRSSVVLLVIVLTLGMPGFFEIAVSSGARGMPNLLLRVLLVLEFILPLALLLAVLFTVSGMARHHELTALRAAGLSMPRIMYPVFLVGIVAVVTSLALRAANPSLFVEGVSGAEAETAHHARMAYPLTNLLAVVIGVSLGVSRRRRSLYVGFPSAMIIFATYYVVSSSAGTMGKHGGLSPAVAGWLAPAVFSGVAGVLWWKVAHR